MDFSNCKRAVLAVNRSPDVTPVYGRSRKAVFGPAFTPGCGDTEPLFPPYPEVSAAFTRLLRRAGRSPVNRADSTIVEVRCTGPRRSTRRKRRAEYRFAERAVNGPNAADRSQSERTSSSDCGLAAVITSGKEVT